MSEVYRLRDRGTAGSEDEGGSRRDDTQGLLARIRELEGRELELLLAMAAMALALYGGGS